MSTVRKTSFELSGAGGGPLRGDVRTAGSGAGRPPVVLIHGSQGFKDWGFFPHLAERLARAGMTAISVNLSTSGVGPDGETYLEPEREGQGNRWNDLADVAAVCGALRDGMLREGLVPADRYGFFGHGRGGATAVLHAAGDVAVRALVTWAAAVRPLQGDADTVGSWRARRQLDDQAASSETPDVAGAAARVGAPWLILHGDADETVSVHEADELWRAANRHTAQIFLVPAGTHAFGCTHPWAGQTAELASAVDRTVRWFSQYLF